MVAVSRVYDYQLVLRFRCLELIRRQGCLSQQSVLICTDTSTYWAPGQSLPCLTKKWLLFFFAVRFLYRKICKESLLRLPIAVPFLSIRCTCSDAKSCCGHVSCVFCLRTSFLGCICDHTQHDKLCKNKSTSCLLQLLRIQLFKRSIASGYVAWAKQVKVIFCLIKECEWMCLLAFDWYQYHLSSYQLMCNTPDVVKRSV